MAGHLFGYEAALAIDTSAHPLREVRAAVAAVVSSAALDTSSGDDLLVRLGPAIEGPTATFLDGLRVGSYDGDLEAGTAVRIASLLRYATGLLPLDVYQIEHGAVGTPSRVVEDLTAALTAGIEELTRPVDAIKHQAKTVTVGISRSDEELLQVPLVARGARRRCRARRAQLPRRSARSCRSTPRSSRSRASPATASRATSPATTPPSTSSTGAASPSTCVRAPTTTRA